MLNSVENLLLLFILQLKIYSRILIPDYLKHAKCLDDASKTEEAKEQYAYVEAALEDLNDKPAEKKLPTACW